MPGVSNLNLTDEEIKILAAMIAASMQASQIELNSGRCEPLRAAQLQEALDVGGKVLQAMGFSSGPVMKPGLQI
jgi:hypothetical protein